MTVIGAWVGAVYTLFNFGINQVFITDLPIFFNTREFAGSLIGYSLVCAVMGLVVNLPYQTLPAVVLTSFCAGAAIFTGSIMRAAGNGDGLAFDFLFMVYSFFPLVVLIMPFTGLLRWSAGRLQNVVGCAWKNWRNWGLVGAVTLMAALLGSLSLYTGESLRILERTNELIRQSQVSGKENVPAEFESVVPTIQRASRDYALQWTDNVNEFPGEIYLEDSYASFRMQIVFAYFDSGETIACLFRAMDAGVYWCAAPE